MRDLTKLDPQLDVGKALCRAVIETPKGRRSKFDYDTETGLFRVKSLLPEGMSFPLDYGFIPSTLCDDGDPLDLMVLADEPSAIGALVDVRLIGLLVIEEHENGRVERNDRLLAVSAISHLYVDVRSPSDLPSPFIDHLSDFWVHKAKLGGKGLTVLGQEEAPAAVEAVRKAIKAFKK